MPVIGLSADLEWKLVYVGSAEDEKYDQTLESVLVGPVNMGSFRFVFQVSILYARIKGIFRRPASKRSRQDLSSMCGKIALAFRMQVFP